MIRTAIAGFCASTLLFGSASAGAGAGAGPTVTPASGGGGVPVVPGFTHFDPAVVGYEQSEVFLSGTASAADGSFAPYTTRAVVMRPVKPGRFNGTVVVEWLNVTGGADAGTDWMLAHNELVREGFVWVGVSAQRVGVHALKGPDPERGDAVRYANLSHPGDTYANDIFTQVGQAIRDDARIVLGVLTPNHLIAVGESQSASRLVSYINGVQPVAGVYDGFLVHSYLGGAPISDAGVPVLVFQTETDVSTSNGTVRQPDTSTYRLWEVTGTAHYDFYGLTIQAEDTGDGQGAVEMLASMQNPTNQPNPRFTCGVPINTGPAHFVLDAAFFQLDRWVTKGIVPPVAPRLEVTSVSPVVFATDANGNALGGIRTPAVDAPVATLSGRAAGGTSFCFLFGSTTPFTPAQLEALYPTHEKFVSAWVRATKSARAAGFLVAADAKELIAAARTSDIGK